jgi:AraC-like DNA-binding protein
VQFLTKYALIMPLSRNVSRGPFEIPVLKNDGPFFRPSIIGHETIGKDYAQRLYHDYSADALEKMELVLITFGGFAQIEFANRQERLRRGSVLLLNLPCEARIYLRPNGCPWEFFYIFASDRNPMAALQWLRNQSGNLVHLPARLGSTTALISHCKHLTTDLLQRENQNLTTCSERTYAWFLDLARSLSEHRSGETGPRHGEVVQAAKVVTGCHTIKEYARQLRYSPAHLSRKLAKTWQKPPGRTLRIARLEQAANLLQSTDLLVWEIASRVGYFSTSSFIRAFHTYYGTTPALFRHVPPSHRPKAPSAGPTTPTPSTTSAKGKASRPQDRA